MKKKNRDIKNKLKYWLKRHHKRIIKTAFSITFQLMLVPIFLYFRVFFHEIGHMLTALNHGAIIMDYKISLEEGYIVYMAIGIEDWQTKQILINAFYNVLLYGILIIIIFRKRIVIVFTGITVLFIEFWYFNQFHVVGYDVYEYLQLCTVEEAIFVKNFFTTGLLMVCIATIVTPPIMVVSYVRKIQKEENYY